MPAEWLPVGAALAEWLPVGAAPAEWLPVAEWLEFAACAGIDGGGHCVFGGGVRIMSASGALS